MALINFPILSPEQASPYTSGINNALKTMLSLKYAPDQAEAELALKKAQAQQAEAFSKLPGGYQLPGVAGQVQAIDAIGKAVGYDNPLYLQAKNAWELDQQSQRQSMAYQQALTQTLPQRILTTPGKLITEANRTAETGTPEVNLNISESNQKNKSLPSLTSSQLLKLRQYYNDNGIIDPSIMPENKESQVLNKPDSIALPSSKKGLDSKQIYDFYQLQIQKGASTSDAQKRNLFASNIEKTLNSINPDDLVRYSGAGGTTKRLIEEYALAPFGKESKEYDSYANSLNASELLAKQVRQFYGDSIQPAMAKKIEKLTNPSTWSNNPKLAKELFLNFKKILESEMSTYRNSIQNVKSYRGEEVKQNTSQITQEDLEYTAKKRGMTIEQVKQRLGIE